MAVGCSDRKQSMAPRQLVGWHGSTRALIARATAVTILALVAASSGAQSQEMPGVDSALVRRVQEAVLGGSPVLAAQGWPSGSSGR